MVREPRWPTTERNGSPRCCRAGVAAISTRRLQSTAGQIESTIAVIGDSDFADNRAFNQWGNSDFLLNTINFLAEEKDLIAIRPKEGLGDTVFLTASQGRLIFLLCVVLLPLSVIVFGVSVFVSNRKKG